MEFKDEYDEELHYKMLITRLSKKNGNDLNEYHSTNNLHDWIDSSGRTLLHYSALYGNAFTTQWLLNYGLDINAQTKNGKTPLMIAAEHDQENTVKILLAANADIEIVDNSGKSVLGYIYNHTLINSTIPLAIMLKLLRKCETEEEVAIKLSNANCPLYAAVLLKNSYITKLLIEKGAKINARVPYDNYSALHVAVRLHDLKNVEVLLSSGVDVNIESSSGVTPIEFICAEHNDYQPGEQLKVLKALLDRGANLVTSRSHHIGKILLQGDMEVIEVILQTNPNLYARDKWGDTPLHYLARNSNPGVFKLLQNHVIDMSLASNNGYTMLHYAASYGHVSTIQWLLDRGADVNCQNNKGTMPLLHALVRHSQHIQDIECVELLLQYGAEVPMMSNKEYGFFCKVVSYGRDLTFIDVAINRNIIHLIQPVLAHLAMLEATGTLIKIEISRSINSDARFKNSFNTYKQQLEQLKTIHIYESVTMFDLLTMCEKQLLIHLKNEHLSLKLQQGDYKNNQGVYYRKLRLRITSAYRKVQLKVRTLEALCKIMELSYKTHPIITYEICSYLSRQDLVLLGQI